MILENICGPALLYLGFSIIQIVIDLYKGLYNTTFIKFVVMVIFTLFLNILCSAGLSTISWFIVFIPFITMTIITTLLLYVFGLDPSMGIRQTGMGMDMMGSNTGYIFHYNNTDVWEVVFADGTIEIITVNNGYYTLYGEEFQLLNTNPITIEWQDGTIQTVQNITTDGQVYWSTTHSLPKYQYIIWRRSSSSNPTPINNMDMGMDMGMDLSPCPPNMTPDDYNRFYGGNCATKNTLDDFHYRTSGRFRITYYDGFEEIIEIRNGSYIINGTTYTLINTTPITIEWPDGTVQTLDIIEETYIRWTTNHSATKYKYIIWELLPTNRLY